MRCVTMFGPLMKRVATFSLALTCSFPSLPSLAAVEPSPEALALVQRALDAASRDLRSPETEAVLSASIDTWRREKLPEDELAGLLKLRADSRLTSDVAGARRDLDEEVRLLVGNTDADPAELPRALLERARLKFDARDWAGCASDLRAAIDEDDALPAIERDNPYTWELLGRSERQLGKYADAASAFGSAEREHARVGDSIRSVKAAADRALALYDATDDDLVEFESRRVFGMKSRPASNNPEDIPLLQDLSRQDAELHLALGARLFATGRTADATNAWATGALRLRAYVDDARRRLVDDDAADLPGTTAGKQIADAARALSAVASGLDPSNPYVTQRVGQEFLWYEFPSQDGVAAGPGRDGDAATKRRRVGADKANDPRLATVDAALSSDNFGDPAWLAANRPDWPPRLRDDAARFFRSGQATRAADVRLGER